MGPKTILFDGYNIVRNMPGMAQAEHVSLASGREALITRLVAAYRHTPHQVVVVFDGSGTARSIHPIPGLPRGQIVYTSASETADSVIAILGVERRRMGEDVTVVSDDRQVRSGAATAGAATAVVGDLADRLAEPPRHLRKRFQHQQAVRELQRVADEDRNPGRRKGNPRKSARRRKITDERPL